MKRARQKLNHIDIFVVRLNSIGELRNSRPCCKCLEMMQKYGIRRVYYSTGGLLSGDPNEIICEKVSSMNSYHIAKGDMKVKLNDDEYLNQWFDKIPIMYSIKEYDRFFILMKFDIYYKYSNSNIILSKIDDKKYLIIIQNKKKNLNYNKIFSLK